MTLKTGTDRVALIGAGLIAASRVPALRAAGLEVTAVGSRPTSARLHDFAARHEIPCVFDDWRELLKKTDLFDALVISTWPDGTPEVLTEAVRVGVPVLVEKPVAWNSATHRKLMALPHDHVIVGYNRRFYESVQAARREVQGGPPLIAQLTLPTDVKVPAVHDPSGRYMQEFYESVSALGLDLTRFVFGDLRVERVSRLMHENGNVSGLVATLMSPRGDIIHLTGNWSTAANYSLTLSRPGRRFELLPFEVATGYEGIEIVPPTEDYPIRRYMPKAVERILLDGVDLQQKPGFVAEANVLKGMIAGKEPPSESARLEDAAAITALCEQLTGVTLHDENPNVPTG
jgi:predicted dehydrogenase